MCLLGLIRYFTCIFKNAGQYLKGSKHSWLVLNTCIWTISSIDQPSEYIILIVNFTIKNNMLDLNSMLLL